MEAINADSMGDYHSGQQIQQSLNNKNSGQIDLQVLNGEIVLMRALCHGWCYFWLWVRKITFLIQRLWMWDANSKICI